MSLHLRNGKIDTAEWHATDNCDSRPHPAFINTLVIHAISLPPSEFGHNYVKDFFTNQLEIEAHPYFSEIANLTVSAHFYIKRDGRLLQFVATQQRAWHAGLSCFEQQSAVNDFSLGIELEGCDDQPFSNQQYACLSELSLTLMQHYPAISAKRIVAHSDISPGRKTDPGPCFDWPRFYQSLR